MGLVHNNLKLEGGTESIMEGIINVHNSDDEVVSGSGGDNQTEYR